MFFFFDSLYDMIRGLLAARKGLPSQANALRTVRMGAMVPAVVVGVLLGFFAVSDRAGLGVQVAAAAVVGAGFAVVMGLAVTAAYRTFGFGAVSMVADALMAGFLGVFGSLLLVPLLLVPLGVSHEKWWLLTLPPLLGACVAIGIGRAIGWKIDDGKSPPDSTQQ